MVDKNIDFSKWYESIIIQSNLASHGLVKGTFLLHPKGYYIWDKIQQFINNHFAKHKISNVLFPSILPLESIEKEKSKLSEFTPEVITLNKSYDISTKTFLRPTSEIIFTHYFKKQLKTYLNLPILVNQWCNIYRIEKNTKLFLRNTEFYWQEVHSLHLTDSETIKYVKIYHEIYKDLLKNLLCMGYLSGEKTKNETFLGANKTLTVESIMQDGQCLQMATSHDLSNNFAEIFDLKYTDKENKMQVPYQSSAGCSTRLIGGLIMSHSDEKGLILPWDLSMVKVKILVLDNAVSQEDEISLKINNQLNSLKIEYLWDFTNNSLGKKLTQSEIDGIPLSIIIGKKEVFEKDTLIIKSRINNEKISIKISELKIFVEKFSKEFNEKLLNKHKTFLSNSIVESNNYDDLLMKIKNKKVVLAPWFNNKENEINFINEGHNITPRCIKEFIHSNTSIKCFYSNKIANCFAYFGRSY